MKLRSYQSSIFNQIAEKQSDCVFQLETGGGKTAIIAKLNTKPTINIAHRIFLVEQISNTLTLNKIPHKIIAPAKIVKRCQLFQRNHGIQSECCEKSDVYVGTVQSIASRHRSGSLKMDTSLNYNVIIDECHHVAQGNMWAKMRDIFTNARFIGATATPCRLDGQGLHKSCGGLFDELIQADELRENGTLTLISKGFLANYEAYTKPAISKLYYDDVYYDDTTKELVYTESRILPKKLTSRGDFTTAELKKWASSAFSVESYGEIISHYKSLANDKTAIAFCPSIDVAEQVSLLFQKNGYIATYISSKLSIVENMRRIDAFKSGQVKILCNVEMATEGFDLPNAECLIILRPTASLTLHRQMIGRVMRPKSGGQKAIIIDHVGNILTHGLPDDKIEWTLTGTPKNKSPRVIDCSECGFVHNYYLKRCPKCGNGNWLRSVDDGEGFRTLGLGVYDVELVKKMRQEVQEHELEEKKRMAQEAEAKRLMSEIVVSSKFHSYKSGAIGSLCEKLSHWFITQMKQSTIDIVEINQLTNCNSDLSDFWIKNFNIKDLNTENVAKCESALKKWLKSK